MGIPYLTKHLLPYAEIIYGLDGLEVVIDGPSLVYHVHRRLLGWMNPNCDILDYQPSCDEISRGVSSYLLQLTRLGVKIHKICFDGALPVAKRATRLSRIEKSRRRLVVARRTLDLPATPKCRETIPTEPGQVWCNRGLPRGRRGLPENPFMVSAVYEDLRRRWNKQAIQAEVHNDIDCLAEANEYPWTEITVMVSGEADIECARVSRRMGCAVLTDDSDLLLHDLGPSGAVLFLDSFQSPSRVWDPVNPQIQGLRICPNSLALRLGVTSIQRFGYELTKDPHLRFAEITRKSKAGATELSSDYHEFLREYQPPTQVSALGAKQLSHLMDPRISELFWQYELPDTYSLGGPPHVYLGLLNEDPARRCAWEYGREYRGLSYSVLNISRATDNQFAVVQEFVRRGERIVADQVALSGTKTTISELRILRQRLDLARSTLGSSADSFWFMFALSEIYRETSNTRSLPTGGQLELFLTSGYTKGGTDWTDIHLLAQVQAILYSLRMLQQLLNIAASKDLDEFQSLLLGLPPLHIMMSRQRLIGSFPNTQVLRYMISQLLTTYG